MGAGALVSDYGIGDTNFDTMMLTLDKTYKGNMSLSLTEMSTSTVPAIAAGSWVENNGALFKFDTESVISTTDPVTSTTVADGTVYMVLVPSGSSITAAFTATAPTWSDSKQGYYGTGALANYRHVARVLKATASYTDKFVIEGYYSFIENAYIEDATIGNDLTIKNDVVGSINCYDYSPNPSSAAFTDNSLGVTTSTNYIYLDIYKPCTFLLSMPIQLDIGGYAKLSSSIYLDGAWVTEDITTSSVYLFSSILHMNLIPTASYSLNTVNIIISLNPGQYRITKSYKGASSVNRFYLTGKIVGCYGHDDLSTSVGIVYDVS